MENSLESSPSVLGEPTQSLPNSPAESLLHLLYQIGSPQPKWVYWNTKTLKNLTKDGLISFDIRAKQISLTEEGKKWIQNQPPKDSIDLVKWMKNKSFCRLQRLIRQKKCHKLIEHLARTNRLFELHDLFLKIREKKHKIWKNRLVKESEATRVHLGREKNDYLVLDVTTSGPYELEAELLNLQQNFITRVTNLPLYVVGPYISSTRAECLKKLCAPKYYL